MQLAFALAFEGVSDFICCIMEAFVFMGAFVCEFADLPLPCHHLSLSGLEGRRRGGVDGVVDHFFQVLILELCAEFLVQQRVQLNTEFVIG